MLESKKSVRVITYGTFDLLHYGHIRFLKRAKELGDYLIVGVTSDDYDKSRGKINVQQTLIERIEGIRSLGLADEIIVEEYEGQKIDDIKRLDVDVFTVGSDWIGKFDYLGDYCKVTYLDRTDGVSSSDIRASERNVKLGLVGDREENILSKYVNESLFVNGIDIVGIASEGELTNDILLKLPKYSSYDELLADCDAVYIISNPADHFGQIKKALEAGVNVLCESPIAINKNDVMELFRLAESKDLVLMDAIKTAYSTAYDRLLLITKGCKIGKIVSIDSTCTSLRNIQDSEVPTAWNSICGWGPTAMLPIFQIMGTDFIDEQITTYYWDEKTKYDAFTHIQFNYPNGVGTIKVGRGVKSEGELVISGTEGYIYVPAPWWKTDYFEIRYEDINKNKRYFYQLEGEGIRYELVAFVKAIESKKNYSYINKNVSITIGKVMEDYYRCNNMKVLSV